MCELEVVSRFDFFRFVFVESDGGAVASIAGSERPGSLAAFPNARTPHLYRTERSGFSCKVKNLAV